jgi:hypothetical protein
METTIIRSGSNINNTDLNINKEHLHEIEQLKNKYLNDLRDIKNEFNHKTILLNEKYNILEVKYNELSEQNKKNLGNLELSMSNFNYLVKKLAIPSEYSKLKASYNELKIRYDELSEFSMSNFNYLVKKLAISSEYSKLKASYDEKSSCEIDTDYRQQITSLKTKLDTNTEQYQKLLIKHNSSMKTHRYIKFKKTDPCFYIIDSGIDCDCLRYKFGITGLDQGNNIDDRLRCHRTLWPQLKVRYLLFVKNVEMIEKSFKMMFEKEINPNGHEIIEGVTFDQMIERIEKLFDILCIKEYHIIPEDKLKEYNDYVDTTVKVI